MKGGYQWAEKREMARAGAEKRWKKKKKKKKKKKTKISMP
jgi:hypothetical protein